jgi:hypothetical protein
MSFMIDVPENLNAASREGRLHLLREARRVALELIANNDIESGAIVLVGFRQKHGQHYDAVVRGGVLCWFFIHLIRHCFSWQVLRVSKLLNDHFQMIEFPQNRRVLRKCERAAYRKYVIPYRKSVR